MTTCQTCKTCPMEFIFGWDDPNTGYAYNLYVCNICGVIAKNDVWENAGTLLIDIHNKVEEIK